jgi:peptide/nickel transport system permease protein
MGTQIAMRQIAKAWLILFFLAAVVSIRFENQIEAHSLSQTLTFARDAFGRNCFSLVLVGCFESMCAILPVGFLCLGLSFLAALFISSAPKKTEFLQRLILDALSSLPGFLIALALSVFFPNQEATLFLASFFIIFPWLTRFLESQIYSFKQKEFILASHALGATQVKIFRTHLLPELVQIIFAILPYLATRLLLLETSLSFLGLGKISDHETWGRLIYQGRDYLTEAPWILTIAGIPLCITLFSLHLITRDDRL